MEKPERDLLEKLAWSIEAMAVLPDDPWRELARAVRAYRDGAEEINDYYRVIRFQEELMRTLFTETDRAAIRGWLTSLRPPQPKGRPAE